jgi:chemotaxis protein CheD
LRTWNALSEPQNGGFNDVLRRVEIGGLVVSSDPDDVLISYALGSCLGLAVYDPVLRIGGLIHSKVPIARQARPELGGGPAICADVGTMTLLQRIYDAGGRKERLIVTIAGCGNPVAAITHDIGRRNHTIARKVLWKNGLLVHAEDVGGDKPRTIQLNVGDGEVTVKSHGETIRLG